MLHLPPQASAVISAEPGRFTVTARYARAAAPESLNDQTGLINQTLLMYCDRVSAQQVTVLPGFLRLAGHPLRWQLLSELAWSDRQVRELTALTGQPQNLVSYHLARLREGGLVSTRRSSADRRDVYYSADLVRCGRQLTAVGEALHPGLRLIPPPLGKPGASAQVLFLCTGNSARSQMAQAILEQMAGEAVTASSAGSNPKPVHPNAIAVLREHGIDISSRHPQHLSVFAGQRFSYVVTLCDRLRETCPDFAGPQETIHWSIPDPGAGGGTDAETYPAFRAVAADLRTRIGFLLARTGDTASPPPGSQEVG